MSTFSFYSMQKTTYLWLTDQTSDVYDLIDWAFDDNNVQHNDGDDVIMEVVLMLTVIQILNLSFDPSTGLKREELRRQRSNTISNILVIILMSAVSLKMFRKIYQEKLL